MKSKSFNDLESISSYMYQSGAIPQFIHSRPSAIARDLSNDQKIRRISPLPQERFSQFSANVIYPIPTFTANQYQLPLRINQQPSTNIDNKKNIQDLIARIQRLEMKSQKNDKLESRIQKLQINMNKYHLKLQNFEIRNDQLLQNNQNRMNSQNCGVKNEEQLKQRFKNLITREQLQRQLIGLDSAFKTLIKQMKSNTNIEMRQVHTKEKKAMIQVVASQISDKLQVFKSSFIQEVTNKIQKTVQYYVNNCFISKNIIEKSKQKSSGPSIPIKINQSLQYTSNGTQKSLTISESTYFIDTQGFILDSSYAYLLDNSNSKIKLSQSHLDSLRKEGLLIYNKQVYKSSIKDKLSSNFNEQ